jgi:hypothetical protein
MDPIWLLPLLFLLPVAVGLGLRRLTRKRDYVAEYSKINSGLQRWHDRIKSRSGEQPAQGLDALLDYARHFLGRAVTALEFRQVPRAQDHQTLATAILGVADELVDNNLEYSPIFEKLLYTLQFMKDMKFNDALHELNVGGFVEEPGLQIRQLGLACQLWIYRTRGMHENAHTVEQLLAEMPLKFEQAGL